METWNLEIQDGEDVDVLRRPGLDIIRICTVYFNISTNCFSLTLNKEFNKGIAGNNFQLKMPKMLIQ